MEHQCLKHGGIQVVKKETMTEKKQADLYYSAMWLLVDYIRDYDRDEKFVHFVDTMGPGDMRELLLETLKDQDTEMYLKAVKFGLND